ncbi:hypothetical protein NBRC111894_195 [Sporolactobacillus inulinus]|uniref:Uncharacterized protein n=1 Tax=Sporolactobacillus inulinus TaxID=2078 RepID=A0A4Y1Z6W2_9BACL|nr:hypothetical protein NBRC111894_195 [Sporolactobacillus inulinus]
MFGIVWEYQVKNLLPIVSLLSIISKETYLLYLMTIWKSKEVK